MRQVLIRRGRIQVAEVPAPLVEAGHVLVEVAYSLISTGTELGSKQSSGQTLLGKVMERPERVTQLWHSLRTQGVAKTIAKVRGQVDAPAIPTGYSCAGVVLQVGAGVVGLTPGDRVACAGAGIANHAEIVIVPRNLTVRVPDGCGLKEAASVTLGAIALQGVRRAGPQLGETVAVIGLGLLGQITQQLLKASGCRVAGLDVDARRVELAREAGADLALNPAEADLDNEIRHWTGGRGVDAAIITAASSSDAIVQQAMEITRKKGRVVVVGAVGLGLKRSPFYEKEIDFLISCAYGPGRYDEQYEEKGRDYPYAYVRWTENRNMEEYLRLVGEGKVDLGKVLDREYDVAEAQRAYADLEGAAEKPLGALLKYPVAGGGPIAAKRETRVVLTNPAADGKVRLAVIGAGNFAKTMHLANLATLPGLYHLRAVVSSTGSNARETAQRFGADYADTDFGQVLRDPEVDAVLICTRHHHHAEMAIQAARAGKAILLEKPMARNREELDELVGVLRETKVPFLVGFNRRFSPAVRRVREIIAGRSNPLMILYRVNAGYLPPDHWTQTEEGGGRLIGEGCHALDLFRCLAGAPLRDVEAVSLAPRTDHVLAGDNVAATLRYADGSVATLLYTALGSPALGKEYMELYVDGKTLVLDDYRSLRVHGASSRGWKAGVQDKGHLEELRVFAEWLRGNGVPPIPLEELEETTRASFAIAGQILC